MLISVYDDDDFRAVHKNPDCVVVCPNNDCASRLAAKANKNGTRWLAAWPNSVSCNHHVVPLTPKPAVRPSEGGGGVETAEHRWMKARIARVCAVMGHDAFVEHQPTHADVFVPGSGVALEYQRWDTEFAQRNLARRRVGAAQTIWFFPDPPRSVTKRADTALAELFKSRVFRHGGLFIKAANMDDARLIQRPWNHPEDREMSRTTRLYVGGSVATYDREHNTLRLSSSYPLHYFLDQVFKDERTLQEANVRFKSGAVARRLVWVRRSDLQKIEAGHAQRELELSSEIDEQEEQARSAIPVQQREHEDVSAARSRTAELPDDTAAVGESTTTSLSNRETGPNPEQESARAASTFVLGQQPPERLLPLAHEKRLMKADSLLRRLLHRLWR